MWGKLDSRISTNLKNTKYLENIIWRQNNDLMKEQAVALELPYVIMDN